MKKTYYNPVMNEINIQATTAILTVSGGGVGNGGTLGNEYNSGDKEYSREALFDDDDWEED